jgi:hypothetical protein
VSVIRNSTLAASFGEITGRLRQAILFSSEISQSARLVAIAMTYRANASIWDKRRKLWTWESVDHLLLRLGYDRDPRTAKRQREELVASGMLVRAGKYPGRTQMPIFAFSLEWFERAEKRLDLEEEKWRKLHEAWIDDADEGMAPASHLDQQGMTHASSLDLQGMTPVSPRGDSHVTQGVAPVSSRGDTGATQILKETLSQTSTKPTTRGARAAAFDEEGFAAWYKIYPRHKKRPDAAKAYASARKIATAEELLEAAKRYADQVRRERDERPDADKYVPFPATWLRAEQWLDEPDDGRPRYGSEFSEPRKPKTPPPRSNGAPATEQTVTYNAEGRRVPSKPPPRD